MIYENFQKSKSNGWPIPKSNINAQIADSSIVNISKENIRGYQQVNPRFFYEWYILWSDGFASEDKLMARIAFLAQGFNFHGVK